MPFLDSICRSYQSLFRHNHPDEARLVELHSSGQTELFLDQYYAHEYQKGKDAVSRFSDLSKDWQTGRSLDFGCGAGGLTFRIAEVCQSVVGIDIEKYKLDYARAQCDILKVNNVEFICYDGGNVPLPEASFDSIFCIDVIEHLPSPERFLKDFLRLLKPGGVLLLSFGPPWGHAHGKHMWAKLPGWWTHLLFPQSVVMRVSGFPQNTTWEQLGMHRLTVGKFERLIAQTSFETIFYTKLIKKVLYPLKYVPLVRELFISEVVGVFKKPI